MWLLLDSLAFNAPTFVVRFDTCVSDLLLRILARPVSIVSLLDRALRKLPSPSHSTHF